MSSKAATVDEATAPASTGPLTGPGRLFIAAILAWFAGELLYALAINDRFTLLARYDNPLFEKPQVDDMAVLADNFRGAFLLVLVATIVAFVAGWAMFVSKGMSSRKASGGPSVGLAAVSILIPVLNLFPPYTTLRAIWASTHPADASGQTPPAIGLWQMAWVLTNVLGIASILFALAIGSGGKPLYELHTFAQKDLFLASLGLWMGSAAMAGVSAVLLVHIVLQIMKADAKAA
jgi:hypothetical protein